MEYGADGITRDHRSRTGRWSRRRSPATRAGACAHRTWPYSTVTTPDGRRKVATSERTVELKQPRRPVQRRDADRRDDASTARRRGATYDGATRDAHEHLGREPRGLDDLRRQGRTRSRTDYGAGVAPRTLSWDTHGRLTKVVQGAREVTYGYDAAKPQRLADPHRRREPHRHLRLRQRRARDLGHAAEQRRPTASRTTTSATARASRCPTARRTRYGFSPTADFTSYTAPGVARADARATTTTDSPGSTTLPGRGTTTLARKPDGRLTGAGEAAFATPTPDRATQLADRPRDASARRVRLRRRAEPTVAAGELRYGYTSDTAADSIRARRRRASCTVR